MKTNSRKVGQSGEITRRNAAKTTVYKYKVAANPTKQKKRTREEGQKVRKVGRAVTFDASESEKETRERLRGGAKNHRANGSLRGGGSYGERIAGARGGIRDGVIALCRDLCAVGCARAEWQNAPVRRRGCLRGYNGTMGKIHCRKIK